jgi:hypothetical protein
MPALYDLAVQRGDGGAPAAEGEISIAGERPEDARQRRFHHVPNHYPYRRRAYAIEVGFAEKYRRSIRRNPLRR